MEDEAYNHRCPPSGEWWDYDRPTFVLDRREFETAGKAHRSSKGCWDHCTYYADPATYHAERRQTARPACFETLDLPADATIAQIKAAYRRLSRATHPDAGGTNHDFVRIRQSYEEALRIAAGAGVGHSQVQKWDGRTWQRVLTSGHVNGTWINGMESESSFHF